MISVTNSSPKEYYRRNLPHYQPEYATFFITFRLAGSFPLDVVKKIKDEKRITSLSTTAKKEKQSFSKFDKLLDSIGCGPKWLAEEKVAILVAEAIRKRDQLEYDLDAYCLMPNHLHLVIKLERSGASLYKIMQSFKTYTARACNKILNRNGAFWQHESNDHVVRNGKELEKIISYALNNPVKAGLVDSQEKWKWSYLSTE
jgi:putative transposase